MDRTTASSGSPTTFVFSCRWYAMCSTGRAGKSPLTLVPDGRGVHRCVDRMRGAGLCRQRRLSSRRVLVSEDMPPRLAAWQAGGPLHALFIVCRETGCNPHFHVAHPAPHIPSASAPHVTLYRNGF